MNLFKNIQIKILAIVSALLLWLFVVAVENYVYLYPTELPVKVINLGQNVSVANELSKVKVRYKASDNTVASVNSNEFELFVDAQNLNEGNYYLEVNYISKNPKVTIVSIEPSNLGLDLEAITSKEIKLKTEVSGSPAKGFEAKVVKLSNDTIKISGAASVLSKIAELPIKINVDGTENADFSRKIIPVAPANWNLSGKTISFDPPVIQVDIEVRKLLTLENQPNSEANNPSTNTNTSTIGGQLIKKTLMAQIIKANNFTTTIKELLPENILVTVEGEQSEIDKLKNNSITLNLSESEVVKGIYTVNEKDIIIPKTILVKIVEFSPSKVLIKF